jgi:hypothetical protein
MLTKSRAVCFCQPVTATISANVAPLARLIGVMISALLLARSALGFLAGFLNCALLSFRDWPSWRPCACASPRERLDPAFSPRRLRSCSSVSPGPGCGRHIHHQGSEKLQPDSAVIKPARRLSCCGGTELAGGFHLIYTRQNDDHRISDQNRRYSVGLQKPFIFQGLKFRQAGALVENCFEVERILPFPSLLRMIN